MKGYRPSRRHLLLASCSVLAIGMATRASIFGGPARIVRALTAFFPNPDSARKIGEAVVAVPDFSLGSGDAGDRLDRSLGLVQWEDSGGSPDELRARLNDLVRADYASGRIHPVAGCYLSETEINLCLAALEITA